MLASIRRVVLAVLCAGLLLVGGLAALRSHRDAQSHRPVTLPASLAGLAPIPAPGDFGSSTSWTKAIAPLMGGAAFAGRAYGSAKGGPLLNLTVARTDLTGMLDERVGAAPFVQRGLVTCTQTMDLARMVGMTSAPKADPKKVLCWRNSRSLSVVVWTVLSPGDYVGPTATAVDQAWRAAG